MQTVAVNLGERTYPIHIGAKLIASAELVAPYLAGGRVVFVTNDVVAPLYLEQAKSTFTAAQLAGSGGSSCKAIVLPDGEAHKNLAAVGHIYDQLLAGKYDRNTVLVALGGGVVGDITGFAAATYLRGIQFIQMPTTLLAQVDASVGGKTGVNRRQGKNLVGAFHQPSLVLADLGTLSTLPQREMRAGYAEVLKYGVLGDRGFFDWLEEHGDAVLGMEQAPLEEAVARSVSAKARIVAEDEQETSGARALLNLGHTFGHALEAEARSVRGGGDGTGNRLVGDVPKVGHGQTRGVEHGVQVEQPDARLDPDAPGVVVDVDNRCQVVEGDENIVGPGDGRERVPGADHLHPAPIGGRLPDERHHLDLGAWSTDQGGPGALVPRPVPPGAVGADPAHGFTSPAGPPTRSRAPRRRRRQSLGRWFSCSPPAASSLDGGVILAPPAGFKGPYGQEQEECDHA